MCTYIYIFLFIYIYIYIYVCDAQLAERPWCILLSQSWALGSTLSQPVGELATFCLRSPTCPDRPQQDLAGECGSRARPHA